MNLKAMCRQAMTMALEPRSCRSAWAQKKTNGRRVPVCAACVRKGKFIVDWKEINTAPLDK